MGCTHGHLHSLPTQLKGCKKHKRSGWPAEISFTSVNRLSTQQVWAQLNLHCLKGSATLAPTVLSQQSLRQYIYTLYLPPPLPNSLLVTTYRAMDWSALLLFKCKECWLQKRAKGRNSNRSIVFCCWVTHVTCAFSSEVPASGKSTERRVDTVSQSHWSFLCIHH